MCKHEEHPRPEGICSKCDTVTCKLGKEDCFCLVGFPYEYQCPKCRDVPKRIDAGYCVCNLSWAGVPVVTPKLRKTA